MNDLGIRVWQKDREILTFLQAKKVRILYIIKLKKWKRIQGVVDKINIGFLY
jgi:hypothetical protein